MILRKNNLGQKVEVLLQIGIQLCEKRHIKQNQLEALVVCENVEKLSPVMFMDEGIFILMHCFYD